MANKSFLASHQPTIQSPLLPHHNHNLVKKRRATICIVSASVLALLIFFFFPRTNIDVDVEGTVKPSQFRFSPNPFPGLEVDVEIPLTVKNPNFFQITVNNLNGELFYHEKNLGVLYGKNLVLTAREKTKLKITLNERIGFMGDEFQVLINLQKDCTSQKQLKTANMINVHLVGSADVSALFLNNINIPFDVAFDMTCPSF